MTHEQQIHTLMTEASNLIAAQLTTKETFLARIDKRYAERNWNGLPNSFTADAVKHLFVQMKPFFDKRDIRARIEASRARTFADLRDAINLMNYL